MIDNKELISATKPIIHIFFITAALMAGAAGLPHMIVAGLSKIYSGKIMCHILRKITKGEVSSLGGTTTLPDPGL